ncbi:MAG: peptidoglycan-binding domain-containing protein [Oscillospiraceae bacterium]
MRSFLRQAPDPIEVMQQMLREVSFSHVVLPHIIPNGLFDEATLEAVMIFQRDFIPPVTGIVDYPTWDALAILYRRLLNSSD